MDVPYEALESLKCSQCHRYLSIVPTFRHLSSEKLSCGLCIPKEDKILEMPYEMVASHLYFPCKYEKLGCRKKFLPCEMKQHEMFCTYANYICPLKCKWQRPMSEILNHYRDKHNSHLIVENKDFQLSSGEPMYLVVAREGLFLMKMVSLTPNKIMLSIIELLETNNKKYSCKIFTGTNQDKLGTYNIPEDKTITFTIDNEKNNGIFSITIINSLVKLPSLLKENWQLLNALNCKKCQTWMSPPIYQNIYGDNICKNCVKDSRVFITNKSETRNYILEKICNKVIYPCKHFDCNSLLTSSDKDNHENFCKFARIACPNSGCIHKMQKNDLMCHLRKLHRSQVVDFNIIKFNYTEAAIYDYVYLERHTSVFRVTQKFLRRCFLWAVECIDEFKRFEQYLFTIRICNRIGDEIVVEQRCSNYEFKEFDFNNNDDFVELPLKLIKPYIVNKQLEYFIHIDKIF